MSILKILVCVSINACIGYVRMYARLIVNTSTVVDDQTLHPLFSALDTRKYDAFCMLLFSKNEREKNSRRDRSVNGGSHPVHAGLQ